jgi:nicotinate-nucleotide--dimethylbenzimidazole phosphoribosyltransferase
VHLSGQIQVTLVLPEIPPIDAAARDAARARLDQLTKPRDSLGRLESLAERLAGIQGRSLPRIDRRLIVVAAADHGVTAQSVSAYPAEVTTQMVRNFLDGGAAVCVLARQFGAELRVIDAGVRERIEDPRIVDLRMGPGTADFSAAPAMTAATATRAVQAGIDFAGEIDADAVVCGEMGIGNSTAAAAVAAALLGLRAADVVGPGTGVDLEGMARKRRVVDAALALHRPDASDAVDVLAKVGGFEIAVLSGVVIGCAAARRVVLVDGLISTAAALVASRLSPASPDYMIAGHLSTEPGQPHILRDLGLTPVLDLELRLGEGTGAALALPSLDAACRLLSEMATFDEAAVSRRQGDAAAGIE